MTLLTLACRRPFVSIVLPRLATLHYRVRRLWLAATSPARGKLRPLEWVLLLIGLVAVFAFVYVLWRQPVSRR
jgi:hypothetical protein